MILKVSNVEIGLVEYMNQLKGLPDTLGFEDKCIAIVRKEKLSDQFNSLVKKRNNVVQEY